MLSRRYKRCKGKKKEPLSVELKVQIILAVIGYILQLLEWFSKN
ncbi:hypothetical protein [Streptococcus sciuri]|uniref:Transposase n=1 Tax=Streptococcus sciuri TaxID=2973939 RepID=A0ABT2F991_9STRE|nr:hypothetical protein [Streptococcus sciuri]MCS4488385.1 hypothetical protein [Streptococcus sciuri]